MINDLEDNNNNNPYQEDSYEGNDKEIILYNKYNKKRRKKYIACNNGKVFYEEDEDIYNVYRNLGLLDNYINKNSIKSNRKLSQNDAIPNKKKLKKKNTLINIDNKYNLLKINNNNNNNGNNNRKRKKKLKNKRVRFLNEHFVEYIDVESYKKYNSLLTDQDWNLNKAHAKCTCNIF
jgi:hypothetical protein